MQISRRTLIGSTALGAAGIALGGPALSRPAAPDKTRASATITQLGVRPDTSTDQTRAIQRAIDDAATTATPLLLPPGRYLCGELQLRSGTQLTGVRGASRLVFSGNGRSLLSGEGADYVTLTGLTFDGNNFALQSRRGLLHLIGTPGRTNGHAFRMDDCDLNDIGGCGIWLEDIAGSITANRFGNLSATAVVSFNAQGLLVAQNTIIGAADNGIEILRHSLGDDGSQVIDNRIEDITAGAGGTGQHGNAINAFRAANVIISGNRIRNCDYSAVRGNSASNIHITNNSVSNVREVALYSEFSFEGAVIANNSVDGAAIGISVCNYNEGGRLAVVQGNIIRNLIPRRPLATVPEDAAGVGIYVEADSAVTGNVIDRAPSIGIVSGWGRYMRDVNITGNVIRDTPIGIGVSVVPGAGVTHVADNLIAGARKGAIVGMDHDKTVTPDLTTANAPTSPQIRLGANTVR